MVISMKITSEVSHREFWECNVFFHCKLFNYFFTFTKSCKFNSILFNSILL